VNTLKVVIRGCFNALIVVVLVFLLLLLLRTVVLVLILLNLPVLLQATIALSLCYERSGEYQGSKTTLIYNLILDS